MQKQRYLKMGGDAFCLLHTAGEQDNYIVRAGRGGRGMGVTMGGRHGGRWTVWVCVRACACVCVLCGSVQPINTWQLTPSLFIFSSSSSSSSSPPSSLFLSKSRLEAQARHQLAVGGDGGEAEVESSKQREDREATEVLERRQYRLMRRGDMMWMGPSSTHPSTSPDSASAESLNQQGDLDGRSGNASGRHLEDMLKVSEWK